MKKITMYALLVIMFTGCAQVSLDEVAHEVTNEYTKKFSFTVKGDFVNPTFTKGNTYMTADGVEMTDMYVVDVKDGEIKQSLHQSKDDNDWGAPTMSLTLGTHHILFLASRGQNPTYADGVVTWTKPLDAFYKDYEVTVVKTSNGNRAVTLDRVVTKMELHVEDAIPAGTTSLTLAPSVWYSGWNMLTGEPVLAPADYNVTFSLPSQYAGVSGTYYSIWSLSGGEEWQTNISVTSMAGAIINASAQIIDAPLKTNRTTKFTGSLYSRNSESSISLNAEWLPDYEGLY